MRNQSNYLISNDGINVVDLPYNGKNKSKIQKYNPMKNGYGQVKSSGKPVSYISPIKYIVFNNPGKVYDFLVIKGIDVQNTIGDVYEKAKLYVKRTQQEGVMELVKFAHPDLGIIAEAIGCSNAESSSFDDGKETKKEANASENKKDDKKEENENIIKSMLGKYSNEQIKNFALVALIIALIIYLFRK